MRILITGGSGQLGSEWVQFLNKQSVEFIALSSSDLDITDHQDVRRVLLNLKPDCVINCAAYTKVDDAEEHKNKAFEINASAVGNLADICSEKGMKLIHFSTDYVFPGRAKDEEEFKDGYTESESIDPINTYGKSKWEGEKLINASSCDHIIVRVSWLCGKYGHNFVKTMLRLGQQRDHIKVVNDQVGCPTFCANVVENTWELMNHKLQGTFHLTSLGKITWYDFASEIFMQAGLEVQLEAVTSEEFPTKAPRPSYSLLSTKKIANISGVSLIPWKKGLSKLLSELNI